ncbi:hypothetical protein MON38_00810 [Hymenobacter sp. DH14]|uniref:Gliding motility protein GldL-like N-terminal domain-containing protein n=1 Tax=Hymenobacter cyanobacteriorum TaxID=2926463 RepID=A0A9X1VD35_9BACT|nr:hypothetical protein [Hymenobacter cyanobacteriorum]MCI1185942.1 hypothetical protein [Hymenobacter cyanobacteriorum]
MSDFIATWAATPLAILKWVLLGLLLTSSGIWNNTRLAIGLGLGLALVGVGALFKIEHWVFGDQLLIGGALAVAIAYSLWFRTKSQRELLDYLKLAWVLAAMSAVVAMSLFRPWLKPLASIAEALFWAVALLFVYQRWIRRPAPDSE